MSSQITLTWTTACIYSDLQLLAVSFAGITYDWSNWRDEILSSLLNMFKWYSLRTLQSSGEERGERGRRGF